jgi:hypothetical protein
MTGNGISVKITGLDLIRNNLTAVDPAIIVGIAGANRETADEIANLARNNIKGLNAFDTGGLYESIDIQMSAAGLVFTVGAKAAYAPFVEFGTSPHFPPVEPIREWCRHRGIPEEYAFVIARAISERGTPERPFLYPAFLVGMRNHVDRVRKYVMGTLRGAIK